MKQSPSTHRRIPHRHAEPDVLSLRFSDQEKNKILKLAKQRGQPASRSLMELVDNALDDNEEGNILTIAEINESIEKSEWMLSLSENWDDSGAPKINAQAFDTAKNFLIAFSKWTFERYGLKIPAPVIGPVPDGGVNLEWNEPAFKLLINVPASTPMLANFYGEKKDGSLEGYLSLNTHNNFEPFELLPFFIRPNV